VSWAQLGGLRACMQGKMLQRMLEVPGHSGEGERAGVPAASKRVGCVEWKPWDWSCKNGPCAS
jgi:hypothetical protein